MPAPTQYGDSTKYMEWSLDAVEVPVNDTNVTCCFTLDAPAVAACNRADGLDCVVTLADGTLVVREMRNFSKANSTGILWFQIPAVSTVTGGTTLYIQLGGATVNEANSTAVWQNMYGGACTWSVVSHADDDVNDSGTTGNHGTFNGSAAYGTTSQFGYEAIQVSGDSDYTSFPHNANLAGGNGTTDNARTILGWYKATNYTTVFYLACKGIASGTLDYYLGIASADSKIYHRNFDGIASGYRGRYYNTALGDTGAWRQYAGTYSGANPLTETLIYRQGVQIDDTQTTGGGYTAMDGDNDVLSIGRYSTTYGSFAWCVFRIGQFVLSANQILGSYNIESQAATNGALTVGALTDFATRANLLCIGGGDANANAATEVRIYTAANATTRTGTTAITVDSAQAVVCSSTVQAVRLGLAAVADPTAILYATSAHATSPVAWWNQSSTGDAYERFSLAAVISYAWGIDNSDSDKMVLSYAASGTAVPGTGNLLEISSTVVRVNLGPMIVGGTVAPDSVLHVYGGSAGAVSAVANTILTVEHSSHALISILSATDCISGYVFGSVEDNDAYVLMVDFNDANPYLQIRSGGVAGNLEYYLDAANRWHYWNGRASFYSVGAGATEMLRIDTGEVNINEGGSNAVNFRVETDTLTNGLFVAANLNAVGIGHAVPDRLLHIEQDTATTNAVQYLQRLTETSSGTVATGLGVGMEFELENETQATMYVAGTISTLWAAEASVNADMVFQTMSGASLSEAARFTSAKYLTLQAGLTANESGGDADSRIEGDSLTHMLFLDASAATENIALLAAAAPNWQTMDRGIFIGDSTTVPTGNPASGGFLYSEAGALKWRGSGGTITTVGPA